jgi:lauroyl/myristoyl acyltransferase
MGETKSSDQLLTSARELVNLGGEALFGTDASEFVANVNRLHPARDVYLRSTARAIERCDFADIDPQAAADEVFENFLWTQFGCKLLIAAAPKDTAIYVASHFDTQPVVETLDAIGPSVLACFHYTGFPLAAFAMALSSVSPLICKARNDVLDHSGVGGSNQIVHVSSRSAPVRLMRTLRQGRSVWILFDVVLPSVRAFKGRFLGQMLAIGAGMGKIARLSGRPCIPVCWAMEGDGARLESRSPVLSEGQMEGGILQGLLDRQAEFIRRHPTAWLEWYSILEDAPRLRAAVKKGNEEIWRRLEEL